MKKLLTLLMTLLLVCSLAACGNKPADDSGEGGTPEEGRFFVGFSSVTLNIPYYAEMADVFEKECDKRGWDHTTLINNMNVEQQINDCLDLLQQGVDALVIASWWGDSIHEVLEAAAEAKVPVFFLNWAIITLVLINTEEKWLLNLYGEEYSNYKKRVNRCIPWKRR